MDNDAMDGLEEPTGGVRLQSYLSHCGVASRRGCVEVIEAGRVAINGVVQSARGARVFVGDKVTLDGLEVKTEARLCYVALNKPAGYLCAMADERGRKLARDLLLADYKERLYNVGRLDLESEGLIIFTNDGRFAKHVSHPSSLIEKEYIVDTFNPVPKTLCADFMRGIRIPISECDDTIDDHFQDVFYRCKSATERNRRQVAVTLIEGKNREIRRVFRHYDAPIKRLRRVRIGPVELGDLPLGAHRDLTQKEVAALMAQAPLTK